MTGKAVIRILFVIALMITAHAIKPFSLDNVTTHLLGTARSFSFVLPDSAVAGIEHANYLAAALGVGVREGLDSSATLWASPILVKYEMASAQIAPWEEGIKTSKRAKATQRPGSLKRAVRAIKTDRGDLIAAREQAPVELPAAPAFDEVMTLSLPVVHSFAESLAFTVMHEVGVLSAALFVPRQGDCEPREAKPLRLVAVVEERGKLKLMPFKLKSTDCKIETEAVEAEAAPVTVGPEEQAEQATETQAAETQAVESISKPTDACPVKP